MKKCPYCAEEIQDEAIICRFCNKNLKPKEKTCGKEICGKRIIGLFLAIIGGISVLILCIYLAVSLHKKIHPVSDSNPPFISQAIPEESIPEQRESVKEIKPLLTLKYFNSLNRINMDSCREFEQGPIFDATVKVMRTKNLPPDAPFRNIAYVYYVSLDEDQIEEAVVFPGWSRGASGNGDILIFKGDKLIGSLFGGALAIERIKTDGYSNILTYYHMSAYEGNITRWKWDSYFKEYKEAETREFNTRKG